MTDQEKDQMTKADAPMAFPFGRRGPLLAFIFVALVVVAPFIYGFSGGGLLKPNGENVAADFGALYMAGDLAVEEGAAAPYEWRRLTQRFNGFFGFESGGMIWSYPPPALFPFMALAQLPYRWAAFVWMAGGVLAFALALRALRFPAPMIAVGLVLPPVSIALAGGQVSLLAAAAFGAGLAVLDRRPILAGVLFGLMALKPQIAVLVPVALLFGRQWHALAASVMTVVIMVAIAGLAFDPSVWPAALAGLETSAKALETQMLPTFRMPSLYVYAVTLGLDANPARALQMGSAVVAAGVVGWTWSRHRNVGDGPHGGSTLAIRASVLVAATPLVSPYIYDYDLLILVLPILWLWNEGRLTDWKYGEPWVLIFSVVLFGTPSEISQWLGFQPGWLVAVALLALAIRRIRAAPSGVHGTL